MNTKKFSDALSEIDDRYVQEAAQYQKHPPKARWIKWSAAAACLAAVVYMGSRPSLSKPQGDTDNLPLLTVTNDMSDGMGFEGYMAYDITELVNANPWSEELSLSTLPVYQNPLSCNEAQNASGADLDKMRAFLLEIAGRLGLDTDLLTITDDVPDKETQQIIREKFEMAGSVVPEGYFEPTRLIIQTEDLKIEVGQSLTADITFEPAAALPGRYRFTHFSSYEEAVAAGQYLKAQYRGLIGMEEPQMDICGGDYNIYGQQAYSIEFFEAKGNAAEKILHYNFKRAAFYCDDEGKLFLVRISCPDLSQQVGDYPVITLEEAEKLLINGNYLTTVPYEMPGLAHIKKAELIYRSGAREEYFMPYYRFYVELPEESQENGLKTYGAYYVPAVSGEYIANMPVWDERFN